MSADFAGNNSGHCSVGSICSNTCSLKIKLAPKVEFLKFLFGCARTHLWKKIIPPEKKPNFVVFVGLYWCSAVDVDSECVLLLKLAIFLTFLLLK